MEEEDYTPDIGGEYDDDDAPAGGFESNEGGSANGNAMEAIADKAKNAMSGALSQKNLMFLGITFGVFFAISFILTLTNGHSVGSAFIRSFIAGLFATGVVFAVRTVITSMFGEIQPANEGQSEGAGSSFAFDGNESAGENEGEDASPMSAPDSDDDNAYASAPASAGDGSPASAGSVSKSAKGDHERDKIDRLNLNMSAVDDLEDDGAPSPTESSASKKEEKSGENEPKAVDKKADIGHNNAKTSTPESGGGGSITDIVFPEDDAGGAAIADTTPEPTDAGGKADASDSESSSASSGGGASAIGGGFATSRPSGPSSIRTEGQNLIYERGNEEIKFPNNPELMAKAVKTMLDKEE